MPMGLSDIEAIVEDARAELVRARNIQDAAYRLAVICARTEAYVGNANDFAIFESKPTAEEFRAATNEVLGYYAESRK